MFDFLSSKQRTISLIARRPNVDKFEHNTSISVAMKTFEMSEFKKIYRKKSFFQKAHNFLKHFNVLRLQATCTNNLVKIARVV